MKKLLTLSASALAASMVATPSSAAVVIDQAATITSTYLAWSGPGVTIGQSFKQTASNIAGAGVFLSPNLGVASTVTVSLYSALPTGAGSLLASASASGTPGNYVDVFWSPVAITAEQTYYLTFTTTAGGIIYFSGDGLPTNYTRGSYFQNNVIVDAYDLGFRTYADNAPVGGAVPEPATWALLIGGFAVAGMQLRRRKVRVAFG